MDIYIYNTNEYSDDALSELAPLCEKSGMNPNSIIAHGMVKKQLAAFYGIKADGIRFCYSNNGKPYYKDDLKFSISHSGDIVAIAFGKSELGIDVEAIRSRKISPGILRRTAADDEAAAIMKSENPLEEFLKMWTVKEAYFKMTGTGILYPNKISADKIKDICNVHTVKTDRYIISTSEI